MSRSLFLSITSVMALWGCGNDCGPMGASDVGLVASSDMVTLTYGHLSASANNDCPAAGAPAGVVSLTIAGVQTDGTGLITLCVPRPDQLASMALPLGSDVKVVDASGDYMSCTFALDTTRIPTGTVKGAGMCGNGTDHAGFQLVFDGGLPLRRTCGATLDSVAVTLRGTIAVSVP
jgi:hypothetical protein